MNHSLGKNLLKILGVLALQEPLAHAANWAWDTAPDTTHFSGGNWTSGTTPGSGTGTPASGDSLYFGTSSLLSLTNDDANFTFAGLTFNSGANAFTNAGNAFSLDGGITNNSASLQIISNNIILAANGGVSLGGGSLTLAGVISDGGNGFSLTRTAGSGNTLTLAGANTFSGALNLDAGTLAIGTLSNLGNSTNIECGSASTSTLAASGSVTVPATTTITVGSGASFDARENTASDTLQIAGLITGAGNGNESSSSGIVWFSNPGNNYTGNFSMGYGTMQFSSVANAGAASALGAGTTAYTINNSSSAATFSYVGAGNSTTTRAINWTATTGALALDSSGTGSVQFLATNAFRSTGSGAATLTLQGSSVGTNMLSQVINDSAVSGATTLVKSGAGTWILNNTNTFSGSTTINAGVLQLGDGTALNGSVAGAISNNATLIFANPSALTAANPISGPGTVIKNAVGTLTLSGTNTDTGKTVINSGTLAIGAMGSIASSTTINITAGATLDVSAVSGGYLLEAGQTLNGLGATATINGNLNLDSGSLALTFSPATPVLTITGGALTFSNNSVTVTIPTETTLTTGSYELISLGTGGSITGSVTSSLVILDDSGNRNQPVFLQITNSGLYFVISASTATAPTATTLTSSPNPSIAGTVPTTFFATVSPMPTNNEMVAFLDGTNLLGFSPLTNGATAFSTRALAVGTHLITAVYGQDALYESSTSSVLTQIVNQVALPYPQGTAFPLLMYEVDSTYTNLSAYGWNVMQQYGQVTNNDVNNFLAGLMTNNQAGPAIIPCNGTTDPYTAWTQAAVQSWIQSIDSNSNIACWYLPEQMLPWYPTETNLLSEYQSWTRQYDPQQRPVFEYTENSFTAADVSGVVPYVDVIDISCYCEEVNMPHAWVRYKIQQAGAGGVALAGDTLGGNYLAGQKTLVAGLSIAAYTNNTPSEPTPAQTYHDFWSAIVSGARGIAVYSYFHAMNDDPANLTNNLNQVNLAASQITGPEQLGSVILNGTVNSNVTFQVTAGPTNTVSFIPLGLTTNVQYTSLNVLSKTWNGSVYVIAVNSTSNSVTATITNLPLPASSAALPFEARSVMMTNGSFSDTFAAWGVHIYKIAASTDTWAGSSGSKFSTATNWTYSVGAGPIASGDSLVFAATGSTTPTNDEINYTFDNLAFASDANAYTITGNPFSLNGSISNGAVNSQIISNNIVLATNTSVNLAAGSLTLAGVISDGGDGFSLTRVSSGSGNTLTLAGANTFTGGINLNAGTLSISALTNLGGGNSIVCGSASSSTLSASGPVTIPAATTITVDSSASFNAKAATASDTLQIAALITGAGNGNASSSSGTAWFSNPNNNYTGNFSMGYGTFEFSSVANAGVPSSLGAGSTAYTIGNSSSTATFGYVGTSNSSTVRALNWTATTGTLALDSSGTGSVQFLATNALRSTGSGAATLILQGTSTGANTLAQPINDSAVSGATTLVKSGIGTWILSGASTYSGSTIVNGGTLQVDGSLGTNTVTITNATLTGEGLVVGATTIESGGTVSPGDNDIGTLSFGNGLTLNSGSLTSLAISKNGGVLTNDHVSVTGPLSLNGSLVVTNTGTNALAAGDTCELFRATSFTSNFATITLPALATGLYWFTNNLPINGTLAASNITFTLTYTASAGGAISGLGPQTVNYGTSGTAVTAVPNLGYYFVNWSDGSTANPRTDTDVTANLSVTANFAIYTYTLTYTAGANGSLAGTSPQVVNYGTTGTAVTAVPNTGYYFTNWSDGSTANPRTDTNVTANVTVTANFAIYTYTMTYTAGTNGNLTGTSPQTVNYGASGTALTAMPSVDCHFSGWSDGSTANPRTDTNVTSNITVTANFAASTDTWVGGSGNNFSTLANWSYSAGTGPLTNGDSLMFAAAGSTTPSNDEVGLTLFGITFTNSAGSYTITGNPLTLNGSISNGATSTQIISNNIVLATNDSVNLAAGSLTLAGNISDGGNGFSLTRASSGSGNTLTLAGANTFTGGLSLNAGTLAISALTNLGGGDSINCGGASASTIAASGSITIPATTTITVGSGASFAAKENTAATTFEISALITGAGNGNQGSSSGTVWFSNTGNNYTGNFSMGYGTMLFSSVANAGTASSLGAGSTAYAIGNSSSTATFSYVGSANSSTTRALNWTATTGALALDSSGTGSVQFLATNALRSTGSGATTLTLQGSNTGANTLAQPINDSAVSGATTLVKSGTGTWILSGASTYSGPTTVSGGTLQVDGSLGTNTTTIATTATLAGTGTAKGATTIQSGGTLSPGDKGIGTLSFSNTLTLSGGSLTSLGLSKNGGVLTNDLVSVFSTLALNGSLTVTNTGTNALAAGDTCKLFRAASFTGGFTNLILPALTTGLTWYTNNLPVNGTIAVSNLTFTLTYTAGANGTISGTSPQIVDYGASGTAVTAVASTNYHFVKWSDGYTLNPRTDTGVTANISVTADFTNGLPASWLTNKVGVVSATNIAGYSGKTFTLSGAGTGLSTSTDGFWFVYLPATNNLTITALISSQQTNGLSPLAGVMVRANTNSGAVFAFMGLSPTNRGKWIYRATTNTISSTTTFTNLPVPYWVQLVRSTNTFTGSVSSNGISWTQAASLSITNLSTNALVGLVVSSGTSNTLNTAVFNNVTVTNNGTVLFQPEVIGEPVAAAAQFDSFSVTEGLANFTITGNAGTAWLLEESDDLINWIPVEAITLIGGQLNQSQPDNALPTQFFRLVQTQ